MNGILLVDKPQDWTSNDVVCKLKGVLHEKRIGHSGTLDPLATGLLVVFVGRATRGVSFAENHDKRYIASFRPGLSTDTQDITGESISECAPDFTEEELQNALESFLGETQQLPPMYSALKVNGRKLYDLARNGQSVERKPRTIRVDEICCTRRDGEDYVLNIRCSKGTYIRTICHDLGEKLRCGGCMSALRRVEAGRFSVTQAYTMDQIIEAAAEGKAQSLLLNIDSLFSEYPAVEAEACCEAKIRVGNESVFRNLPDGTYRVYSHSGEFLMLGRCLSGTMRIIKSFYEVST